MDPKNFASMRKFHIKPGKEHDLKANKTFTTTTPHCNMASTMDETGLCLRGSRRHPYAMLCVFIILPIFFVPFLKL
jgi:hypothetical protein